MSWQNNWTSMPPPGINPQYPQSTWASAHQMPPTAPVHGQFGAVNNDQYNQWQWQQYQQQYAQWYAMYGEKYAQQTGNALPSVAAPMPQNVPNIAYTTTAPPPIGPAFGPISVVAPPPPSEPHPDELRMGKITVKPPPPEEKSSEEIAFDEQFRKWEQEFETWKKTNANHPDKAAYREYEQKYEEQRKKLLDHREQLRRRRNAVAPNPRSSAVSASLQKPPPPPPPQSAQPPPPQPPPSQQPQQPRVQEPNIRGAENTQPDEDAGRDSMQLQNVFNSPSKGSRDGFIPGLDLIDETPDPPEPKRAKLDENVVDLSNDEEEAKLKVSKPPVQSNPNNMISNLLNDPNVNALLQLVGKTISGNGAGGSGIAANPLVTALAQLTGTTNADNLDQHRAKSAERPPNGMMEIKEPQSNGSRCNGPNDQSALPSPMPPSGVVNDGIVRGVRGNPVQNFNPYVPPPLLDVDLSRPPPLMRPHGNMLSQRDRSGRNSDAASDNGSFNDGYYSGGDGSPLPKMARFDRPPPSIGDEQHEYEIDPELGRPVAVPKPDWMTEDEYQEIYDRYEFVQSFDERKNKMLLAIQVLKQSKIRAGRLVEPVGETHRGPVEMPTPLPPVKPAIKTEPEDEYFQPQQVFDYSNCRSTEGAAPRNQLSTGRVIDYGHRGVNQYGSNTNNNNRLNNNSRRDEFRGMNHRGREGNENGFGAHTQRFDYNHSRVGNTAPVAPLQQSQKWPLSNQPPAYERSVPGLERLAQMHLNPNPEESNPNYPSKFLLMNDNRPNCLSTKRAKRPSSIRKQKLRQQQMQQQQAEHPQQQSQPQSEQERPHQEEPEPEPAQPAQGDQTPSAVMCKQEPELQLEDLSSDDGNVTDDGEGDAADRSNNESVESLKQEPADERPDSSISSLSSQNLSLPPMIEIDDLLLPPGRYQRPLRTCFLIRGLPGSGKSHLARLIKNKEQSYGQSPRVLSLDDYFLVDKEEEEKDPVTGKVTKVTRSVYEFDAEMEDIYIQNLLKAFKRTISERLFNFVIVDCCNHRLETYCEFHNYARSNGFKVYTCTMQTDVEECARQNIHNRTEAEIQVYADNWAMAPDEHLQINFNSLLEPEMPEDTNTTVADMELAGVDEDGPDELVDDTGPLDQISTSLDDSLESFAEGSAECDLFASKWDHDTSEQNLARLDGINKPLKRPPTLEDYLQLDDDNDDDEQESEGPNGPKPGGKKKRVRWADVEERKAQEKMRQLGFVVGVTDWKRMMDPSEGSSALTQTKYIARVKK